MKGRLQNVNKQLDFKMTTFGPQFDAFENIFWAQKTLEIHLAA